MHNKLNQKSMAEDTEKLQEGMQPEAQSTEAEAKGTGTTEETNAPRGRAALLVRYKERHPDKNWDEMDDDAIADQAMADYDEKDAELGKYKDRDKSLEALFANNPQSAAFLMDMAQGGDDDAVERVYKHFGEDIVAAMEDPNEREKLKEIRRKKQEDLDNAIKAKQEWETNMQGSLQTLQDYKTENNLTDEELQTGLDLIDKVVSEFEQGKISPETFAMFMKGNKYDGDIAKAKADGERDGRNAKIDEGMRRKAHEESGLPMVGGNAGDASGRPMRRNARGTGNIGSGIWDSANMERHKYE